MTWVKKNKIVSSIITALLGVIFWLGADGLFTLYDKVDNALHHEEQLAKAAIQKFVAVNNNETHYSYALNSPVSGDTLYVHWKWARHTGGAYCYYYTIDGADVKNSYYHARVAGKCNPKGFSLADKPEGFGFNSSIGVNLPYGIPEGNYTITYYHLENDGYHDKYQEWVSFDPIPFEVKTYVGED